jgi:hypothetical protein
MYTISLPSGTLRKDGAVIEQDDSKQPYITYALWLAAGNGPTEIADQEEKPTRPHITVSAWQLRHMLIMQGMHEQVKQAVAASGDEMMMTGWEYATEIHSDSALLLAMLPNLGLSEDQMYAMFEQAKAL